LSQAHTKKAAPRHLRVLETTAPTSQFKLENQTGERQRAT